MRVSISREESLATTWEEVQYEGAFNVVWNALDPNHSFESISLVL
jgi:hypothetical protein